MSTSIVNTSKLRIKQRDYTIPVRLNQEMASSSPINHFHEHYQQNKQLKQRETSSASSFLQRVNIMMTCKFKISSPLNYEKHRGSKLQFHSNQLPNCLIFTIIAIIITITVHATTCFCDKITTSKSMSGQISDLSTTQKGIANNINNYDYNSAQKNIKIIVNPKLNEKSHNNNNLMTVLSENIERQHFKIKPINVFIHKRPSKFDSGEEDLLSGDDVDQLHHQTLITSSTSNHPQLNNSYKQHQLNDNSLNNKAKQQKMNKFNSIDENMNHILNMHQHATQMKASHVNNQQQSSSKTPTGGNKWRNQIVNGGLNPVKVASNLINQNKKISQLFSYITPLVSGTKLLNNNNQSSSLLLSSNDHLEQTKSLPSQQLTNYSEQQEKNVNSNLTTKFINSLMTPFVARSINNHFFGGLETNKHQSPFLKPSSSSLGNSFVLSTVSPAQQTSYLPKPPDFLSKLSSKTSTTVGPSQSMLNQYSSLIDSSDLSSKDLDSSKSLLSELNQVPSVTTTTTTTTRDNSRNSFVSNFVGGNKVSSLHLANSGPLTWPMVGAVTKPNQMAHNYIQDSFRALLTMSQLPILPGGQISTAPSVLEKAKKYKINDTNHNNRTTTFNNSSSSNIQQSFLLSLLSEEQRRRALDELYRYAYILGTGVRRKKDPLKALASTSLHNQIKPLFNVLGNKGAPSQRNNQQQLNDNNKQYIKGLKSLLTLTGPYGSTSKAKPRGVVWDMATDPSLAVTVFHLLERASVALPLGFLLMPFVQMIRNPFSAIGLGRILPPRASHRSVDYEELAKRLDVVDKMLSRALRSAHRESSTSFIG